MDVNTILDNIPNYQAYYSVEALHASTQQLLAQYPDVVHIDHLGNSRSGESINSIRIGNGPLTAIVLGGGHPNEPLGSMVIEYFATVLCQNPSWRDALGYTWYFVKCIDPDGARRNEAWATKPFNLRSYTRHYFRPPLQLQPEFNFPFQYKDFVFNQTSPPETKALQRLFEIARPDFFYSLHSGAFGGAFYAVSAPCDDLIQPLQAHLKHCGLQILPHAHIAGDVGNAQSLADGIYLHTGTEEYYDQLVAQGIPHPAKHIPNGGTSFDLARQQGAFILNTEVDICQATYLTDNRVTDVPLQAVISQLQTRYAHLLTLIAAVVPALQDMQNPYNRLLLNHIDFAMPEVSSMEPSNRLATHAERELHEIVPRLRILCEIGQLLGMFEVEQAENNASLKIAQAASMLTEEFTTIWGYVEPRLHYRMVPIRELIAFQLGAGLSAARWRRQTLR